MPRPLNVSFEFFPPATDAAAATLWDCVDRLAPLTPDFVSVTYGAGGSTRERTFDTVERIRRETLLTPAAHLTCVGAPRAEIDRVARNYWRAGIRHIVALRGDPQDNSNCYQPHTHGYAYASDLVAGLKRVADFEISVAAYPETHPEAASAEDDLDNLKRKIDAGACRAITQFFFDNAAFLRFRDRAQAAGISAPIIPGILPVTDFSRVRRFAEQCGTAIPKVMMELFAGLDEDAETRALIAAAFAAEQCRELYGEGVEHFHFYTLNRPQLSLATCRLLGLQPMPEAAAA